MRREQGAENGLQIWEKTSLRRSCAKCRWATNAMVCRFDLYPTYPCPTGMLHRILSVALVELFTGSVVRPILRF